MLNNPKLAGRFVVIKIITTITICMLLVVTASGFSYYSEVKNGDLNVSAVNSISSAQVADNQKENTLSKYILRGDTVELEFSACGNDDKQPLDLDTMSSTHVKKIAVKSKVKFKTIFKKTSNLLRGEKKVVRKGRKGIREKIYKVYYKSGKEVKRILIKKKLVKKPIAKIVKKGTASAVKTSRGTIRYKKKYVVSATAYTAPKGAVTASGAEARVGIIAVDPNLIPLGTRCYVKGLNGDKDYGYCIAGDTGGAIKGKIIDLYMNTYDECINWGRRNVEIYILS